MNAPLPPSSSPPSRVGLEVVSLLRKLLQDAKDKERTLEEQLIQVRAEAQESIEMLKRLGLDPESQHSPLRPLSANIASMVPRAGVVHHSSVTNTPSVVLDSDTATAILVPKTDEDKANELLNEVSQILLRILPNPEVYGVTIFNKDSAVEAIRATVPYAKLIDDIALSKRVGETLSRLAKPLFRIGKFQRIGRPSKVVYVSASWFVNEDVQSGIIKRQHAKVMSFYEYIGGGRVAIAEEDNTTEEQAGSQTEILRGKTITLESPKPEQDLQENVQKPGYKF